MAETGSELIIFAVTVRGKEQETAEETVAAMLNHPCSSDQFLERARGPLPGRAESLKQIGKLASGPVNVIEVPPPAQLVSPAVERFRCGSDSVSQLGSDFEKRCNTRRNFEKQVTLMVRFTLWRNLACLLGREYAVYR